MSGESDVPSVPTSAEAHAVEIVRGVPDARVVVVCEHASERMLDGWALTGRDARLVGTHWAYDLGAAELARELAAALGAPLVLARFSRLIVDANRPEDSPTLFRADADGESIELNREVDAADRERRLARCYRPLHAAVDREVAAARDAEIVFSVHTFTPVYEGVRRTLDAGVLFAREEALAERALDHVRKSGFHAALNEPWSAKDGLMHVAEAHADTHGRRALEIEMRQDLAVDPGHRARMIAALLKVLRGD